MNQLTLEKKDFEAALGESLSDTFGGKIASYHFLYEMMSPRERDAVILRILEVLNSDLMRAGEHRLQQWESGWAENAAAVVAGSPDALIPRYFGKYPVVRWRQEFIKPISPHFEYHMLAAIQDWIFESYLKDVDAIYEFGCGTGHNLARAREVNARAMLYGLDWAMSSQEVIALTAKQDKDIRLKGARFDIFHPDYALALDPNSAVYTVAALEQISDGFKGFVDYLLEKKPSVCIHIEPIGELLDPKNLVDFLSLQYFKKRNYLSGFLEYLRSLEKEGTIVIRKAQRSYIGSLFIEGYSVIVWSPRDGGLKNF